MYITSVACFCAKKVAVKPYSRFLGIFVKRPLHLWYKIRFMSPKFWPLINFQQLKVNWRLFRRDGAGSLIEARERWNKLINSRSNSTVSSWLYIKVCLIIEVSIRIEIIIRSDRHFLSWNFELWKLIVLWCWFLKYRLFHWLQFQRRTYMYCSTCCT